MTGPTQAPRFNEPFVSDLESASRVNASDDPNYYARDPRSLISSSNVDNFMNGTGSAIYNSLSPLLASTNHELILVTCFWAQSDTLQTLNSLLRKLSDRAVQRGTDKITVQLCFSSLSLFQKLFHRQSVEGQTYGPSVWTSKLGLPRPEELGGLNLKVKSIFILPFSVMHPKFMVIDRKTVVLPSCNISWEEWFEGCVTFSGKITEQFLEFYFRFWERRQPSTSDLAPLNDQTSSYQLLETSNTVDKGHGHILTNIGTTDIPTIFLPSPHRRNPRFQPFSSPESLKSPPTPLNAFVLTLFAKAEHRIRIQSPNITSPPVLSALLKSLSRGIDVQILTSERLMVLEQLVTAGTTTSRCVKKLIKRYRKLQTKNCKQIASDEEAAISAARPGHLKISYFEPLNGLKGRGKEDGEPQQSHLKLTIVDGEVLVLGSGNLDRASWFTSQELGVGFFDKGLVQSVERVVDEAMKGRAKVIFDSSS